MNQRPRSFNKATNAWKGKPNFKWAYAQTFTIPQNGSFSSYSSSYQMKLEMVLMDFDSHQERRLSSLETQLGQQQDDMISKINLLWKAVSEKLNDIPIRDTVGYPTTQMNFTSTNYLKKEELQGKGIKSLSKLLSLKHLSQLSLAKQNRNPPSPKRVHFVNLIIILNKNFTYECDFMVLEDVTSVVDHDLGLVVFGKPFVETTGLMLYLIKRSLKVLRKFRWTIFGGRFNQLSHVSSLLLSKPGEY
nr:hypothetical protein [Tanacetum cinerariifolium]